MRWLTHDDPVKRVAIIGGTHGNEVTGLWVSRYVKRWLEECGRDWGFAVEVGEGNPKAVEGNVRYTEEDLNRQFELTKLEDGGLGSYEACRARELNSHYGPKESTEPAFDFIMDLHNTTAATGPSLMMHPKDGFSHEIGCYLTTIDSAVKVVNWPDRDPRVLPSVARSGFTLEVGPVSWGVVDMALFETTKILVLKTLEYLTRHNEHCGKPTGEKVPRSLTVYAADPDAFPPRRFPRSPEGALIGAPHPSLKDFTPLTPTTPVMQLFDGTTYTWDRTDDGLHALFVNEAAYYKEDIAFTVVKKTTRQVMRGFEPHTPQMSVALREILQDDEGCSVFDGYLRELGEAQEGKGGLEVTAVCGVKVEGSDCVAVADNLGYLRYVTLAVASFRVYCVVQEGEEGVMPWVKGSVPTLADVQKTYVKTMSFHPTEYSLYFSLRHGGSLMKTSFVDEPVGGTYPAQIVSKHTRAISATKVGARWVVAGDEGGSVRVVGGGVAEGLHRGVVTAVELVHCERMVVTGSLDGAVNILETETGVVVRKMMVESGRVTVITPFTTTLSDAECFALGNDRGAFLVANPHTAHTLHLLPAMTTAHDAVTSISREPSSQYFSISTSSGSLTVFSRNTFRAITTFTTPYPIVYTDFVSPTGTLVAVSKNGAVWMWGASKIVAEIDVCGNPTTDEVMTDHEEAEEDTGCDKSLGGQEEQVMEEVVERLRPNIAAQLVEVEVEPPPSEHSTDLIEDVVEKSLGVIEQQSPSPRPKTAYDLSKHSLGGLRSLERIEGLKNATSGGERKGGLGGARGEAARRLRASAERTQQEEFDEETFKQSYPGVYRDVRDANPVRDTTGVKSDSPRYGALPGLLPSTDPSDRHGFLTKTVDKQLDTKWVANLTYKPCIEDIPDSLRGYLVSTAPRGETYDCPAPSRGPPYAPLHFPSVDGFVAPFV